MKYRIDKNKFLDRLRIWDSFLRRKVHLIACGGTAMTLLGVKPSTKDIDLIVPDTGEYDYLMKILKEIGYKQVTGAGWSSDDSFIFDFFIGNRVHTTELLESPLKEGNHIFIEEFNHIYLGVLNYYDLIISKLFRATSVDIDDCLSLMEAKRMEIDIDVLTNRLNETASYDISNEKVLKYFESFLEILKKEGMADER